MKMGHLTLTLAGDHYAMGRQHGVQARHLRSQIAQAMESRFHQLELDGSDDQFEQLYRDTRGLLQEIDRPMLAMVQGQAEALEFEFETLLRYSLATFLRDDLIARHGVAVEGCTTWAATGSATVDGRPILAKNRDYHLDHLPLQVMLRLSPQSGYRYLCSGSAGSPVVFCAGINEAGLAVADTHVASTDLGPGLPDFSLMMHLLEEHDTVSSSLDYLRSVPRLGRNNLILADARGRLAVFEIGHRSYGLSESDDGVLVNTNHFVSPELCDCFIDTNAPLLRGNSSARRDKVTGELAAARGEIGVPFARRLMATHDGLLASICRHPLKCDSSASISASIFEPAKKRMLFCHGLPCQGEYGEYLL